MPITSTETIQSIHTYFAGERSEQTLLLAFCGLFLIVGAIFLWRGDLFARGLAIGLLLTALVGGSASIPLLIRDKANVERLTAQPDAATLAIERDRVAKVVSNYPLYRYAYLAVAVLSIIALMVRPSELLTGLGAGLIILACTGFIVDHYSEARAKIYAAALAHV